MAVPPVKEFEKDSIEAQAYAIVEKYKENIPRMNDRNRLGYNLVKKLLGEGDDTFTIVKNNKLILEGISERELAERFAKDLENVKFPDQEEEIETETDDE